MLDATGKIGFIEGAGLLTPAEAGKVPAGVNFEGDPPVRDGMGWRWPPGWWAPVNDDYRESVLEEILENCGISSGFSMQAKIWYHYRQIFLIGARR